MTERACSGCGRLLGAWHQVTCPVGAGYGVSLIDVDPTALPRPERVRRARLARAVRAGTLARYQVNPG